MSHMFGANGCIENIACIQNCGFFLSIDSIFHLNSTIQHSKNLFTVIDVPFVWLVSPVQACGDAAHVGNI